MGDKPVAVVQNNTVNYVTTDQLNTPRAVTTSSEAVVWHRNSDPFGNSQPAGSITYNLRFPGQYHDVETGNDYNYRRDYDPATGRYIESDPVGIGGGTNTYIYTKANPVRMYDSKGTSPYEYLPPDNSYATVVCNGNNQIIPQVPEEYSPCYRDCTYIHENVHILDLYKIGRNACEGHDANTIITWSQPELAWVSEINAYEAGIKCMEAKLNKLPCDDKCKQIIQGKINDDESALLKFANKVLNEPVP